MKISSAAISLIAVMSQPNGGRSQDLLRGGDSKVALASDAGGRDPPQGCIHCKDPEAIDYVAPAPTPAPSTSATTNSPSAAPADESGPSPAPTDSGPPPGCVVENTSEWGNGKCYDGHGYNTKACGWDGGDCCFSTCKGPNCGSRKYRCRDTTADDYGDGLPPAGCDVDYPEYWGNGYCDDYDNYNTAACNYDGGDCCASTCKNGSSTCGEGEDGYHCRDTNASDYVPPAPTHAPSTSAPTTTTHSPSAAPADEYPECDVDPWYRSKIGDGYCDYMVNTAVCGWDGGDCCPSTCTEDWCGGQGYLCDDPDAEENYVTPTTAAPSPAPTTAAPTTAAPTPAPTTAAPTPAPTTAAPTPAPTTAAPTPAPTDKYPDCNVQYPIAVGNGRCDKSGGYNTAACGYDGGDCCASTCKNGLFTCGSNGFDCQDLEAKYPDCNVQYPIAVGNGRCDMIGGYNTAACGYDGGDCCESTCENGPFPCGSNGYSCQDPSVPNSKENICNVPKPEWIGDGWCDKSGGYNTEVCEYDGGDCCASTCVNGASTCGRNGYDCRDPNGDTNAPKEEALN